MVKMLSCEAQDRIKNIHSLSQRYNGQIPEEHLSRILEMMRHHVEEIAELLEQNNPHALVETGDLIILCLEILLEKGGSVDGVLEQCLGRFEKKLSELVKSP